MSADIPRSVMEEAQKFAYRWVIDEAFMLEVARFALSRDKRAAEIIEQVKKHHYINPRIALTVAAKTILTYDTPTGQEDKPCLEQST